MTSVEGTPRVFYDISCFSCLSSSKSSTYFKLDGRKCIREHITDKLKWVFDGAVPDDLISGGRICRSCNVKLTHAWELKNDMTQGYQQFSAVEGTRQKRLANSPITPKMYPPVETPPQSTDCPVPKPTKKVRRQLLPDNPLIDKSGDHTNLKSKESSSLCDHSYNQMGDPASMSATNNPVLREFTESANSMNYTKLQYEIVMAVLYGEYEKAARLIREHTEFFSIIKSGILDIIDQQCQSLCCRSVPFSSVLWRNHSLQQLMECEDLTKLIYTEMKDRVPFLLEMMSTVAISQRMEMKQEHVAPITSAYAILMKRRNPTLSAWHKMTTCATLDGNIDDSALTKLNRLGLSMCPSSKLKMQDDLADHSHDRIVALLKRNPLVKITGDNLDVYIRTAHQASDRRNQDVHLFASNIIFCKVARPDMDNTPPSTDVQPEDILLTDSDRDKMTNAYAVLIGRILKDIPALEWMKDFIPKHIRHGTYGEACRKSEVFQLPIQFKNEAKHDDCLDIMDEYEEHLQRLFTAAHGDTSALDEFKVAVGGDQLTRVRLKEAHELRGLSPTATKRLVHLDPIVCEWWHNKQDFLEKAYKALYKPKSGRQEGTLYHLKMILQLSSVNGKVKQNFQSHHDLLVLLTKHLITEQAMEYFGMETLTSEISANSPGDMLYATKLKKEEATRNTLSDFIHHYGYIAQPGNDMDSHEEQDDVYSYFMQVCHWGLHIMAMDDTAKEADGERSVLNAKYNVPFFFAHSSLSKYMVENILYIMQSYCLSPLHRARVLDCAFVNLKGGKGMSVEADLVQEHAVRHQKTLIRQLGANKTQKAISRATSAANGVIQVSRSIETSLGISHKSNRHCKHISTADTDIIKKTLRKVRPFRVTPGRKCEGFLNCKRSPFCKFQRTMLMDRINHVLQRLKWGERVDVQNCEDDEPQDDPPLPDIYGYRFI